MTYEELWQRLLSVYDAGEAKAVVRYVLDIRFGLTLADVLCGKVTQLSSDNQAELGKIMKRLEKGEPVQYVLGKADFCGRTLCVAPGVLIPRPETAELCCWIAEEKRPSAILDIGTGSGCIAVTLALDIPQSQVTAWDISDAALHTASCNAEQTGAHVVFVKQDVLQVEAAQPMWDVIVSNPPYICVGERHDMERKVLDFEPHLALFVPDEDPLLFYHAIACYAAKALNPGGRLYFELNPLHAVHARALVSSLGFRNVEMRDDQFGKLRFLKAIKI